MNKVYKVIWNHATRTWVAASEIARSKGKTKSVKTAKTALAAAVAVAAVTAGTSAHAAIVIGSEADGVQQGVPSVAAPLTSGTASSTADKTVVIGENAKATGTPGVVIGTNATAIRNENGAGRTVTVIGHDALTRNIQSAGQNRGVTVIGNNALAGLLTSADAVAGDAVSLTDADYATNSGGFTAGRLMYRAGIIDATGATISGLQSNEATAIGLDSRAIGDQSIAIGAQVVAGHGSVAIGANDLGPVNNSSNKATYKAITGADLAANAINSTTGASTGVGTVLDWYDTTYAKEGSTAIGAKAHSNELFGTAIGTSAYVQAGAELGTAIGTGSRVGAQTETLDANMTSTANFTTKGGVAIAAGAVAERDYTTAVGTGAKAIAVNATALGYQALANGTNATAVGAKAIAAAADALAYGGNATAYATNSVAVGTNSTVTRTADSSIAFGTDTSVSGVKTVALGSNIRNVSTAGSVVLGDSSTGVVGTTGASHAVGTVSDAQVTSSNGAVITYGGFAGQPADAGKYVSIGAPKAERQLKNVAAGNIAANSTDGINGSQLYAVAAELGNQVFQSMYFHVNNGTNAGTGDDVTNLGNITDAAGASGLYSVTAGVNATSSSENAIAIGHDSTAGFKAVTGYGVNAIAIGQNSTSSSGNAIAIGTNATVKSEYLGDNADGTPTYSVPLRAIAIGSDSAANGLNSVALGPDALAGENFTIGYNTVAIGNSSTALAQSAVAMGYNSKAAGETSIAIGVGASTASYSDGTETIAIGSTANAGRGQATALGAKARANGSSSLALGSISNAVSTSSIALGTWTQAEGTSAHAIGHRSAAYGDRAMAEGRNAVAANVNASASGVRSVAAGTGSIAIGTNSASGLTRTDADAIIAANDAYTLAMYRDYIAQTKLAADPTNASTIAEAQQTAANLVAARTAVDVALTTARVNAKPDTVAIGTNTTVLGQESAAIGYTNTVETTANGTYVLGSNITATKDNNVILGQNSSEDSATTTKGVANQVNDATVGGATYGGFAGTATGIVSVGAEGAERQIINVAPGEISETSTDAINGSQLYAVYDKAAKPVTFTANTNLDTANTTAGYEGANGLERQLGDTLNIQGADTAIALTRNADAATAGAYSAKNIQTIVDDNGVQIQMSENPVFNSTVIGGSYTNAAGDTITTKPITVGTDANGNNTISNLTTTLPDAVNAATKPADVVTTNAATLGDVLNAGWNLKTADQGDLDFVKPYDTVEFANGNGTTIKSETDGTVNKIQVDVNLTDSTIIGDITSTDGVAAPTTTEDGNKLANVSTVVDAVNNSGWKTNSTTATGPATETLVNPGETVNFEAGKNMEVTQTVTQVDGKDVISYTYATKDDVTFNSTKVGGTYTDAQGNTVNNAPITIGTTPEGKNVISNLNSTLPTTVSTGDKATSTTKVDAPVIAAGDMTNAATLGDVLNAGWNLQTNSTALDFVKPYDTVNFVNGVGTSVVSSTDGNVSNIQYNVNVDNSTTKITYVDATGGELTAETQPDGSVIYKDAAGKEYTGPVTSQITAVQPTTQVNGNNVTGPVNLVDGNTTTVTNTPDGIKVEVNTGNTTVGTDGKAAPLAPADANKVATVGDIINTINNVGWFTNSTTATGGAANTKISAGQAVNFEAGKNMEVTQTVENGNVTYTYATKDDVTFNSTKVGGTYTDAQGNPVNHAPITIGTTPAGKNVISNLNSTLPTTVSTGDKATSTTKVDAPVIATGDMNNAATLGDVLNAGWNLKTADQGDLDFVKPYDTVNFVNGTGTSVVSSTDGNVSNIQYNVNVDGTTTEITYTTKVNGKDVPVYQHVDGNYYTGENGTGTKVETPVTSRVSAILPTTQVNGNNVTGPVNLVDGNTTTVTNTPDGIKVEVNTGNTTVGTDGKAAPLAPADANKVATVGDIINTINNVGWFTNSTTATGGAANTKISAGKAVNFEAGDNMQITQAFDVNGNVTYTYSTKKDVSFNSTNIGAAGNPITIGTVNGDNVISNLDDNLPSTSSTSDKPTTTSSISPAEAAKLAEEKGGNAATVNDVLNAGWNLETNGKPLDFVKPYDTVNFKDGNGTTIVSTTDGATSNIQVDVAVDNSTIKIVDGKLTAVSSKPSITDNQSGDQAGDINFNNTNTTTVNVDDKGNVTVDVNTGTSSATDTGLATPATDKDGNPLVKVVDPKTGDVTYTNAAGDVVDAADVIDNSDKVATVGDIVNTINNTGWQATSGAVGTGKVEGTTTTEVVKPSELVTFQAGDNMVLKQEGQVFTYSVSPDPVFNTTTAKAGITLGDETKENSPVVNMTAVDASTPEAGKVSAIDVAGSTITNLAPNLPETVSTGNATTSTPEQKAPVVTDAQKSNAATLGDVLNAGWNLQGNGEAKDFVKPYDTVNFVNGTGTTAVVTSDGNVSNVTFNVNVDDDTIKVNADGKLYAVASKPTVTSGGKGDINFANTTTTNVTIDPAGDIKVDVNTGKSSVPTTGANAGKAVANTGDDNKVATVGDIVNTINNVYHSVNSGKVADTNGESTYTVTDASKINAGDTVNYNAGKNISISGSGNTINIATTSKVEFDEVKVGPVTINQAGINAGDTKITGVAAGEAPTDAVNVAQLKAAQTTVGSEDQTVTVKETVSPSGQRHYDLSVNVDAGILKPINDRIGALEDDMSAGLAGAAAMVNIPQVTRPGANLVGVGLGHHKGESAIAVGFSSASDNERLIFKMSGTANTQGDYTIGTGMGWQW